MKEAYVKTDIEKEIGTIEFFHPQSNSLPGNILAQLTTAIQEAGKNEKIKVVVLQSAGRKAFCAGASFDELVAIENKEDGLAFFSGFANVINAMRQCPKFIIGRIHGKCVGGGVGLASAVDYAIAKEGAGIKLSELSVGIGPFVVGPAVERKMGKAAFAQLSIDATTWRSANWARGKGLYAEVYPDTDGMDESIKRLAESLVESNPQAMAELKKTCWQGTDHWDTLLAERAAISGELVLSDFTKKAIQQFKKK
ncbi:MAG TPA: enoyl-CoA hydratase/isomerase family protein [Chitinophagaceae bacterium]|nr:enoyl-CoA hydratase/isomerase family protein [Chitinophagaceae bacterium]